MRFVLELDLGNAAMGSGRDIQSALEDAAASVTVRLTFLRLSRVKVPIRDENGNTVGSWSIE